MPLASSDWWRHEENPAVATLANPKLLRGDSLVNKQLTCSNSIGLLED